MFEIKTTEHFDSIVKEQANTVCFLFTSNGHQQDKSFTPILEYECEDNDIVLYNIEIGNKDLFNLINKYGTGLLPKYIFIKENKIIHTAYGLTSKENVRQEIKRAGDSI